MPIDDLVEEVRSLTRDKFKNLHGTMQMLRVSDPVPVDEIYIDLNILDQVSSYHSFSDRCKDFQPDWRNFDRLGLGAVKQKGLPALSKVKDCRRLMVFGKPGSGKTTFLKSLGILCIDKKNQFDEQDYVPIFIRLNKFAEYIHPLKLQTANQEQLHLFDYIYTREFCSWDEINKQVIQTILSNSRTLVLLDGMDEVPKQDRDFVVEEVEKFCNKFYNNRFIISCRTQTHKYKLPGFTEVELDDFKPEQAKKFINHWFKVVEKSSNSDSLASKLTQLLEQPENVQIAELAVTPVLLNLICFVFRNGDDLPTNRAELYKKGIKDLLRGLDESKGINREEVYPNINFDETEKLLTELATDLFKENEYFPQQEKLETFIVSRLGVTKYESEKVLKSIEAKSGLLIERSEGFWSFSHLTFQEYLTAKWFVENNKLDELIEHITDSRWREVFLLVIFILPCADNFLMKMKIKIDTLVSGEAKIQEILVWIKQISNTAPLVLCSNVQIRGFYLDIIYKYFVEHGLISNPNILSHLTLYMGLNKKDNNEIEYILLVDHSLCWIITYMRSYVPNFMFPQHYKIDELCKAIKNSIESCQFLVHRKFLPLEFYALLLELWYDLLSMSNNSENRFMEWCKDKGLAWVDKLKTAVLKYRNIKQDWELDPVQEKLIEDYYITNFLLINSLNSSCVLTDKVRHQIEDSLFLPFDEIKISQE